MERLLITRKELQEWLTAEIQKDEDYQTCEVRGISKLQELDHDGSNWSSAITLNQSGVSAATIQKAIVAAKQRFNLED